MGLRFGRIVSDRNNTGDILPTVPTLVKGMVSPGCAKQTIVVKSQAIRALQRNVYLAIIIHKSVYIQDEL